jgi:hypothetical protein
MTAFPTVLPDQIIADDKRAQLGNFARTLGDPVQRYQRETLAAFAAKLGEPSARMAVHTGRDGDVRAPEPAVGTVGAPAAPHISTAAHGAGAGDAQMATVSPDTSTNPNPILGTALQDTTATSGPVDVSPPAVGPTSPSPDLSAPAALPAASADARAQLAQFATSLGDPTASVAASHNAPQTDHVAPADSNVPPDVSQDLTMPTGTTSGIDAIRAKVAPAFQQYVDAAVQAAQHSGIDPGVFVRQIFQESGFNPQVGSDEGAKGIAQFIDPTARGYGINPWEPRQALDAGARLMAANLKANGGDYRLALAAYNAGQGNVDRYGESIFDPATLLRDGWKSEDAYQPLSYIRAILGGSAVSSSPPAGVPTRSAAAIPGGTVSSSPFTVPPLVPAMTAPGSPAISPDVSGASPDQTNSPASYQTTASPGFTTPPNLGSGLSYVDQTAQSTSSAAGSTFALQPSGEVERELLNQGYSPAYAASAGQTKTDADREREIHDASNAAMSVMGLENAIVGAAPNILAQGAAKLGELASPIAGRGLAALGDIAERGGMADIGRRFLGEETGAAALPNRAEVAKALNTAFAPARNTPPAVQSALRQWVGDRLQAAVEGQTWALRGKRSLGANDTGTSAARFESTGQFSSAPTPEQASLASDFATFGQTSGAAGRAHGYIGGDVVAGGQAPNYFPHLYVDSFDQAGMAASKNLNPRDFYTRARLYPTLADAIAAGKEPVAPSAAMGHYAVHVGMSEADYQFVQKLQAMKPPVAMPYTYGTTLPEGWVPGEDIDKVGKVFAPKPIAIPGPTSVDPPSIIFRPGTAFAPEVAAVLKNVLARSPNLGGLTSALGMAKETLFSLSEFHTISVLRQALRASNPQDAIPILGQAIKNTLNVPYDRFRLTNADLYSEAAGAGVTGLLGGGSPDLGIAARSATSPAAVAVRSAVGGLSGFGAGYSAAKNAGADDRSAFFSGLALGGIGALAGPTLGKAMADALWNRTIPTLKVLTYEIARASTNDPQAAATFVNQTFGGNNLAAIARAPNVQAVIRLGVLAPDWWEGWLRQIGGAFQGGAIGKLSRAYWARTAIEAGVTLEGLNVAINGHLTTQNDPGKQTDLELTGLYDQMGWKHANSRTGMPERVYLDILGPIGQLLRIGLDPTGPIGGFGNFAKAHAGLLPSMAPPLMTGFDYRGQPIAEPGTPRGLSDLATLGYAAARIAPVGLTSLDVANRRGEPLPVTAYSSLTGQRTSRAEGYTPPALPILPDSSQQILRSLGLSYRPEPMATSVRGAPLRGPEEEQYATVYLREMDTLIHQLDDTGTFRRYTPVQRQAELYRIERRARDTAESTLLRQMGPDEYKRRIDAKNAAQTAAAAR